MSIEFVPATRASLPQPGWVYEYRLTSRTEVDEAGCWLWQGPVMPNGYGQANAWGKVWLVHRLAYTVMVDAIPAGLQIDHTCRKRNCINPGHLEPVTQAENLRRQGAAVTSCPNGHPYTPENTYRSPGTPNCRRCRQCARARNARKAARA